MMIALLAFAFGWFVGWLTAIVVCRPVRVRKGSIRWTIAPVDVAGNPAPVDGLPAWSDVNGLFAFEPADGPLSVYAVTLGPVGETTINVSVDADLGAGVVTISGSLDVSITASQAVSLTINHHAGRLAIRETPG